MLVSAIITTKNRKELLVRAINSVLHQTYKEIECVVVDDGSTDGTEKFLEELIKNNSIRYIHIPSNESKGGNHARNVGAKKANGNILAFLDDDDEWMPEKIELQMNKMQRDDKVGFVYCGMVREKNFDKRTRKEDNFESERFDVKNISDIVLRKIVTNTSTIMIKKDLFEIIGGFDEQLTCLQEYDLCVRAFQKTKVDCVKKALVLYRILDGDCKRISNMISGWEKSLKIISEKNKDLFMRLSKQEMSERMICIYLDGIERARRAKSMKFLVKYTAKLFACSGKLSFVGKKLLKGKMQQRI